MMLNIFKTVQLASSSSFCRSFCSCRWHDLVFSEWKQKQEEQQKKKAFHACKGTEEMITFEYRHCIQSLCKIRALSKTWPKGLKEKLQTTSALQGPIKQVLKFFNHVFCRSLENTHTVLYGLKIFAILQPQDEFGAQVIHCNLKMEKYIEVLSLRFQTESA